MRRSLRPIAHAMRSALGTRGVAPRIEAMEERLLAIDAKLETALRAQSNRLDATLQAQADRLEAGLRAQAEQSGGADFKRLNYTALFGDPPIPSEPPTAIKQGSRLCRQGDFATDGFRYWMSCMREPLNLHRKMWEWFFIADALFQRGQLAHGRRGIAFGVGLEPLPSLFASLGAEILATDMAEEGAAAAGWIGQHAANLQALNQRGLCDENLFREKVGFRVLDMNDLPRDLEGGFDFCWSSCALEHLGSLEHGLRFVERSMDLLRPGGIGVHTTEFNMSSNKDTFEAPELSLYRRRDLEALFERLQRDGHQVEPMDWEEGDGIVDGHIDLPPYFSTPMHLRLEIASYACTSIGFIIRKS